jgi:hypothetical protein
MFELIGDPPRLQFSRLTGLPKDWEEVSPKGPDEVLLVRCGENLYWCEDLADLRAIDTVLGHPESFEACVVSADGLFFELIEHDEISTTARPRKRMFILPLPEDKHGDTGRELAIVEVEATRLPPYDLFRYLAPEEYVINYASDRSDAFPWVEVSGPARLLSGKEYALLVEEAATHNPNIRKWQIEGARARAKDS